MMDIMDTASFFERYDKPMYYVAFLKSPESWFPLCSVGDPEGAACLDTLVLSPSLSVMDSVAETFVTQIPQVEMKFVHYLLRSEIMNVIETYGLKKVAVALPESSEVGCGCGCGCS